MHKRDDILADIYEDTLNNTLSWSINVTNNSVRAEYFKKLTKRKRRK